MPAQYFPGPHDQAVIDYLTRAPEALLVGQVAAGLKISRVSARRTLERLCAHGKVASEPKTILLGLFTAYKAL